MKSEKIQVKKRIITDLNEILSKHVPLQYWDKIKSEISPRYKSPVAVLIEIPDEDVKKWYEGVQKWHEAGKHWYDGFPIMIYNQCQKALGPFRNRREEISYIYVDFGGDPKWLRMFSKNDGAWFELLCSSVFPEWDCDIHYIDCEHIPCYYWQNMEDAGLDSESTKQGLHVCVIFCFVPQTLRYYPPVGRNRWFDKYFNEEEDEDDDY